MAGLFSKFFSKKEERVFTVDDEIRIVLLGKTGSGKSHTGNTILCDERFESKSVATSVTKRCMQQARIRKDKKVILVDTPGLFDDQLSNEETKKEVAKCVGLTAPGVHCFLLILQIGRFSPEEKNSVKEFLSMFGEQAKNYIIILFTKIDTLDEGKMSEQDRFKSYLEAVPDNLREVIDMCEDRCIGFNNRAQDKRKKEQVNRLFDMINDMIQKNGGKCYTNEMYLETEKKIQEEIKKQREEELKRERERQEKINRRIEEEKEQKKRKELEIELQKMREENAINQRNAEERIRCDLRRTVEKAEPGIMTKLAGGIWDLVTLNWF